MGYNFIYLLCVLVLIMLALRLFLPILIVLIGVILVIWIIRKLFFSRRQSHEDKEDQEYYESLYRDYQNQDSDVIDVDYKVVDEHENPHQQS